jgi:hypothetical protein
VIVDLDVVVDLQRLREITASLSSDVTAQGLVNLAAPVSTRLKAMPPTITAEEVRELLEQASAIELEWNSSADVELRARLVSICNQLKRMKQLKRGGIFALPMDIRRSLGRIIREAREIGLFLAHVGELEEWLSAENISASKENKPQWANEAAAVLEAVRPRRNDIWAFVAHLGEYLAKSR